MEKTKKENKKNEKEDQGNNLNRYYYVRIGLVDDSDDFDEKVTNTVSKLFRTLAEIAHDQTVTIDTWNSIEDDERKRIFG